jgi:hypothetical protein
VVEQIAAVESGHMLLKGWLRFAGSGFDCAVPYNTRGSPSVQTFLRHLRREWLGAGRTGELPESHRVDGLDIKFSNALDGELDPGETVRSLAFQPPLRARSGDLLVLTDRRLLWITDREKGFRSRYGSIASYAPLAAVRSVELGPDGVLVALNGGLSWHVPVAPERLRDVAPIAQTLPPCRCAPGRT